MKLIALSFFLATALGSNVRADEDWKVIDEGFRFSIPRNWVNNKVQGIDSHVGKYSGKTAYLEFDEFYELGGTVEETQTVIERLKKTESNPKLLKPGEQVWHVNGRIAKFTLEQADRKRYGEREFKNVATLFVPYAGQPEYLHVLVFYESDKDLPKIIRILKSFEWPKKKSVGD